VDTCNAKSISRRSGIAALLLLAAPAVLLAGAAPEIAGEWQGKLAVDASNALTVRFTFSRGANGAYTAVLNSPDNPAVKNTPVSGVSWDGTNLKFSVPSLQGAYAGKLANGRIAGEWTQPGGKLPLELAPWQKAVLSADALKPYLGSWNGVLDLAGQKQTLVFSFKQGAGGALEGTFGIPDQGMTQPMGDLALENGELSFHTLQGRISFKGKLANNRLAGKLKVPSPVAPPDGVDIAMQKGDYSPPPVALALAAGDFAKLKGKWTGKGSFTNPQNNQKIDFDIALRFETGSKGEQYGYVDSAAAGQTSRGVIISSASLAGDKLTFRLAVGQVEFTGTLAGRKLTGEWVQGGMRIPLELTQTP
jgi:hypothetical protein